MHRTYVGFIVAMLTCTAISCSLKSATFNHRRNVVFILSDDHRYDFMGFLGTPKFLRTPNMDRMAKAGAYIKNATVTTALCSPSRASILTGQYSHRHGVVDNNASVPEGTVYFPEYLQKAGYETAFFGKWHMGDDDDRPRRGFDKWVSFKGQGEYYNPTFNVDGERVTLDGYNPELLTDYALTWLTEQRDESRPFFMYLSHKAVHAMFEPAEKDRGRYDDAVLEYPPTMADSEENYTGKPDWVRNQRNSWHGVDYMYYGQMDFDTFYRRYCETLLAVDESIGRVLDALEEADLLQSTLVMYMGDNGFNFGEHGLIDKRQMYEESMRVPFLVMGPDIIEPGRVITELIQNIDIGPTILASAGLEIPEHMDGESFYEILEGKKIPWRVRAFYEYYWERSFPQTPTVHGVRTERYKYMHYHGIWDKDELYDLQSDPAEIRNLIDSPDHRGIVREMNEQMFDWLEETDGMLIPLRRDPPYQLNERKPTP